MEYSLSSKMHYLAKLPRYLNEQKKGAAARKLLHYRFLLAQYGSYQDQPRCYLLNLDY